MKLHTKIAVGVIALVAAVGLTAGVASAQDDGEPGVKGEFVCANLDAIEQLQADHATLLTDRLALLGSARAAAEANGNDQGRRAHRPAHRASDRAPGQGRRAPGEAGGVRRRALLTSHPAGQGPSASS